MINNTQDAKYVEMTTSPIHKLVIKLAIPTVISMLVTAVYNTADTAFVSRLGTSASGAVGIIFALMAIIQAVGFTFGMGAGSLVSRSLGEQDDESANAYSITSIAASLILGGLITLFGLLFLDNIVYALGSTDTIFPYARDYAQIILIGSPIMCCSFVLNNLLRAQGKAQLSMIGLAIGGIINIALDPLLIYTFNMGISGAAWATIISQFISLVILAYLLLSSQSTLKIKINKSIFNIKNYIRIFIIGFPSLCRQGLASIGTIMLNRYAKPFGDSAISAMSIASKVFMFLLCLVLGIGQGFQPVAGYNYGSKHYSRVKESFWFTFKSSLIVICIASIICMIFAPQIMNMFIKNDLDVIDIGTKAIRYQCIAMIFLPVSVTTNMLLQSIGKSFSATVLSCFRQGIFFIPLILILPNKLGLLGIELTQPIADLLTCIFTLPFAYVTLKKLNILQKDVCSLTTDPITINQEDS